MSATTSRSTPVGLGQRERHGDLAAHRMADHRGGPGALGAQRRRDVGGHLGVGHGGGVRRGTMVAQVEREHAMPARRERLLHRAEILPGAEQPVQQGDRPPLAVTRLARLGHRKPHRPTPSPPAAR
jgi:hypothetical protein